MKNKLIHIIPFVLTVGILIYTLILSFFQEDILTVYHYVAAVFILINIYLYLKDYISGIGFTGIILIACAFNYIYIFSEEVSTTFFLKVGENKLKIISYRVEALLILFLYLIINRKEFMSFIKKLTRMKIGKG